jgi:hypothetical protein
MGTNMPSAVLDKRLVQIHDKEHNIDIQTNKYTL